MRLVPVAAIAAAVLLTLVPSAAAPAHATEAGRPASAERLVAYAAPVPTDSQVTPLASSTPLELTFTLARSNQTRLAAALEAVSDPASPEYRHFLTYRQFQSEYGAPGSAFADVASALRSAGATEVVAAPGGTSLTAILPVDDVESLLGVHLVSVVAPGGVAGFTSVGSPSLPPALSAWVTGVDGLSDLEVGGSGDGVIASTLETSSPASGTSAFVKDGGTGDQWFIGTDYAQAYGATELLPGNDSVLDATYPTGVSIATLLASGENVPTATSLPPWDPKVVDAYYNETFPAGWPLPQLTGVPIALPGAGVPLPPGSSGGLNDSFGFEVENVLDLEMAGSLAPGAHLYNFYFNGSLLNNPFAAGSVDQYFADDLGEALSYDYGYHPLAAISCSFGLPDLVNAQWDADLETAAMMGVTVLAASGDQGNAPAAANLRDETPNPLWPASAAFNTSGAVAVGGVTISLSGKPTSTYNYPPITATYDTDVNGIASSTAWWDGSDGPGTYVGTEGGVATNYSEPYWQFHSAAQPAIVNATEVQGTGRLGRSEPDVAFAANSTIIYFGLAGGSTPEFEVVGGTSVAAPLFAGMLADVVAVENATRPGGRTGLGFLDPELYRIASYYRAHPGPNDPIRDVVAGHNFLFQATSGWDATTGWGELNAPLLLLADENTTVSGYTYTGPTPTLPPTVGPLLSPLDIVAIFGAAAAVILVAVYVFVVSRRTPRRAGPAAPSPAGTLLPAWQAVPPPTGAYATFACPYCGAERPAEAGHCPNCGAM